LKRLPKSVMANKIIAVFDTRVEIQNFINKFTATRKIGSSLKK